MNIEFRRFWAISLRSHGVITATSWWYILASAVPCTTQHERFIGGHSRRSLHASASTTPYRRLATASPWLEFGESHGEHCHVSIDEEDIRVTLIGLSQGIMSKISSLLSVRLPHAPTVR